MFNIGDIELLDGGKMTEKEWRLSKEALNECDLKAYIENSKYLWDVTRRHGELYISGYAYPKDKGDMANVDIRDVICVMIDLSQPKAIVMHQSWKDRKIMVETIRDLVEKGECFD